MIISGDDIREAYRTLNLEHGADEEKIKKAYRRAAHKWHPDKHKGDPVYEEKFKQISSAYELLLKYCEQLKKDARSPFTTGMFFYQKDLRVGINLSLSEAYLGCRKRFTYGRNVIHGNLGTAQMNTIELDIPPRSASGKILKIHGQGNVKDGNAGDLFVVINHPYAEENVRCLRTGALHTTVTVPWVDALRGKKASFNLFEQGPLFEIELRPNAPNGETYELKEKGISPNGSLFAQVFYTIPNKIDKEDIEPLSAILEKYNDRRS